MIKEMTEQGYHTTSYNERDIQRHETRRTLPILLIDHPSRLTELGRLQRRVITDEVSDARLATDSFGLTVSRSCSRGCLATCLISREASVS